MFSRAVLLSAAALVLGGHAHAASTCFSIPNVDIMPRYFKFQTGASTLKKPGTYSLLGYSVVPGNGSCEGVAIVVSGVAYVTSTLTVLGFHQFSLGSGCLPVDWQANLTPSTLIGPVNAYNGSNYSGTMAPVACSKVPGP